MAHVSKERLILFVDRLPIVPVKLRIVEVFALNAPGLAINLFPFGARIDLHLELGHVERAIAHLNRNGAIGSHDSPTSSAAGAGLIEKFLFVIRKRI